MEFFWKFVEFLNGKTIKNYLSTECALEEINETHGIIRLNNEVYYTYLIPKDKIEIFHWIEDNIGDIPFKKMKIVRVWWHLHKPTTQQRELYRRTEDELRFL